MEQQLDQSKRRQNSEREPKKKRNDRLIERSTHAIEFIFNPAIWRVVWWTIFAFECFTFPTKL